MTAKKKVKERPKETHRERERETLGGISAHDEQPNQNISLRL